MYLRTCVYARETNRPGVSYTHTGDVRFSPLLYREEHGIALSSFRHANNLPTRALLRDNDEEKDEEEVEDDDDDVARENCIRKYYRAHALRVFGGGS